MAKSSGESANNSEFGEATSVPLAATRQVAMRCKCEGLKAAVDQVAGAIRGFTNLI
jgi:hypothetical protein